MKIAAVALILSLFLSGILYINPSSRLIGDGGDNYQYFGFQYLVSENLKSLKAPFSPTDIFRYPVGFDLSYGFDGVLPVMTGALLGLVIPHVLAYNLTVLVLLIANAGFSYLFFYKLYRNKLVSVIATVFYAYSPFVLARINSHLNLAFTGGFPLLGYSLISLFSRVKENKPRTQLDYLLVTVGLITVVFGSLQYGLILIEIITLAVIFFVIFNSRIAISYCRQFLGYLKQDKFKISVSLAVLILLAAYFYQGYFTHLSDVFTHTSAKSSEIYECCSPSWTDIFVPNQYSGTIWQKLNPSPDSIEKAISIGIFEWLIFSLAAFFFIRRGVYWLIIILALYILFVLNLLPLPFIPEPGRLVVIFSLIASIFSGYYLLNLKRKLLYVVLLVIILERFFFRIYSSSVIDTQVSSVVRALDGEAVLNMPINETDSYKSTLPYFFNKKIIDGYFHYTADGDKSKSFIKNTMLQNLECGQEYSYTENSINNNYQEEFLNFLKTNGIYTLVLFKKLNNEQFYFEECRSMRSWWYRRMPETLIIDKTTEDIGINNYELSYRDIFEFEIYFPYRGIFELTGILLDPPNLTNTTVYLPMNNLIKPDWIVGSSGLESNFADPVLIEVHSGDKIIISSDGKLADTVYLTIFYKFEKTGSVFTKPAFRKVFTSNEHEVYDLN
ncbi:MAG: hypothetical protein UV73_C0001G0246 [Candidatus Gottesmanbacteria bacterium GW2011_GWA2_43_14]|uniref:Glycosyltransferase RgtA/B/C/D-like domain-containing protein n=1 Tax=Candidatus Gottesmanbacteria bacterium GW2011_GWA2_43_14 TaxID=1618443 RepID=A0A0G1DLJ1_9BACT|nr:MAG: hypothetical protein UV73_C0001G0246 [Candidatus Gottesmanbacteria bacterium GW2011_GWA2_43_14]